MKRKHYIMDSGYIWELSHENYLIFLKNAAMGIGYNLNNYGKRLTDCVVDITNNGYLDFERLLEEEKRK